MQDRKFKHDVVYRCYKGFTDRDGDRARKGQRFKLKEYRDGYIIFEKASGRGTDIIFKEETAHHYLCPASESRLNLLINDYINNLTGGVLKRHKHPNSAVDYIWWTDLNDRIVFEAQDADEGLSLGVREDMWNSVNRMFSLSSYDTDIVFLKWMNGMKFPSGVYTFEAD